MAHKARFDGAFFESVAAMQHKGRILHGNDFNLIKPGVDGCLAELSAQPVQHVFPNVCNRFQKKLPFLSVFIEKILYKKEKHIRFIIAKMMWKVYTYSNIIFKKKERKAHYILG
jgi:hypothetical protein